MSTILIGGGSGLIGTRLSKLLTEKGHQVIHLSRRKDLKATFPKYRWDLAKGEIDLEAIKQADYVINLAGAGIVDKRWTNNRKKVIIESRTKSNLLLKKAIEESGHLPKAIIAASAIGYYGDRGKELLEESSTPGKSGFLAESTRAWEKAIEAFGSLETRQVTIRIGIVLSTQGGALKPFILQNRFRLGNYFGSGDQYYSWIHIDDLCRMFIYAIENNSVRGIYNGVGPQPLSLYKFVEAVSAAMDKKAIMLPVPEFAIRLGMGEMADVVLSSAKVSAQKVINQGFEFEHAALVPALKDLLARRV